MPSIGFMDLPSDDGFTLIELLIVVAIIAIIASLATAGLLRSRAAANEAGAIASVRVTSSSQKAYAIACGSGGFASSFVVLGTPVASAAFISADLGSAVSPVKAGYRFNIAPALGSSAGPIDCLGRPTISNYYVTAAPLSYWSGNRSFAVTVNGTIWQITGATPPPEPFGPPARPLQ